jgi:hypothetical protein
VQMGSFRYLILYSQIQNTSSVNVEISKYYGARPLGMATVSFQRRHVRGQY